MMCVLRARSSGDLPPPSPPAEKANKDQPGEASAGDDRLAGRASARHVRNVPTSLQYIRAGKLRALAVTSSTRSELLPDLPTVGDFLPGYEATACYGLGAPTGTPPDIIDKLNKTTNAILADPKVEERFAEIKFAGIKAE
jgi:tripartite-type tricarboxylate transporter receptor subunit TctC